MHCEANNARGMPCQMAPLKGRPYCWAHDPENRQQAAAARRKAGRARSRTLDAEDVSNLDTADVTLTTPADVLRVLELAVRAELAQPNSSRRNATLSTLCGQALKAVEASELDARLRAVEEHLAEGARTRRTMQ